MTSPRMTLPLPLTHHTSPQASSSQPHALLPDQVKDQVDQVQDWVVSSWGRRVRKANVLSLNMCNWCHNYWIWDQCWDRCYEVSCSEMWDSMGASVSLVHCSSYCPLCCLLFFIILTMLTSTTKCAWIMILFPKHGQVRAVQVVVLIGHHLSLLK